MPEENLTNCAFCSSSDIAERTIIRNKLFQAFLTNIPIVPGHLLLCPVRHVSRFDELLPEEVSALGDLINQVRQALIKAVDAAGFNYAWNEGEIAGQSVPHFHLHVVPRKSGDRGIIKYDPREFLYRPGSREKSPGAELRSLAVLLRKHI